MPSVTSKVAHFRVTITFSGPHLTTFEQLVGSHSLRVDPYQVSYVWTQTRWKFFTSNRCGSRSLHLVDHPLKLCSEPRTKRCNALNVKLLRLKVASLRHHFGKHLWWLKLFRRHLLCTRVLYLWMLRPLASMESASRRTWLRYSWRQTWWWKRRY